MYNDPGRRPFNPLKILVVMIIAILIVMAATVVLNGKVSTEPVENNTTNDTNQTTVNVQGNIIGNNTDGTVTKYSGFGDTTSNVHIALIVGVDQKNQASNSIISTLSNAKNLKYDYDIYEINTTNDNTVDETNNTTSNTTLNNKTESLAYEYVVPDIINNNYNFSVDIHGINDSNSYIFVPSNDTYTSKMVVNNISNTTSISKYTPNSYSFAKYVSIPLISSNIPSMVYVSKQYYLNGVSDEINSVISAIDNFDFEHLLENSTINTTTNSSSNLTNNTNQTNQSSNYFLSDGNVEISD